MRILFFPLLLLLALHLLTASGIVHPVAFYDELLYLGFGRAFAHVSHLPDLYHGSLGHWGYGFVIAPAFLLSSDFPTQYRLILGINILLALLTTAGLYALLRAATSLARKTCAWLAFCASLYPSALLYSSFAVSENLLLPLSAWFAALLFSAAARPDLFRLTWLALLAGASYVTHARGSTFCLAAAILIAALWASRRVRLPQALPPLLLLAATAIYVAAYKNHLELISRAQFPPLPLLGATVSRIPPSSLLFSAAGQLLYLALGALGLYFLGLARVATHAFRPPEAASSSRLPNRLLLLIHSLLFAGAAFFISNRFVVSVSPLERADHLVLGRYLEACILPFLALGLAQAWELAGSARSRQPAIAVAASACLLSLFCAFAVSPIFPWASLQGATPRVNSLAVMPWLRIFGQLHWAKLAAATALTVFAAARLRRPAHAAALTGCLAAAFTTGALYYWRTDFLAAQSAPFCTSPSRCFPSAVTAAIESASCATQISVHSDSWIAPYYSFWQLYAPAKSFQVAPSPLPSSCAYIAPRAWDGFSRGYRLGPCEALGDVCLWTR